MAIPILTPRVRHKVFLAARPDNNLLESPKSGKCICKKSKVSSIMGTATLNFRVVTLTIPSKLASCQLQACLRVIWVKNQHPAAIIGGKTQTRSVQVGKDKATAGFIVRGRNKQEGGRRDANKAVERI